MAAPKKPGPPPHPKADPVAAQVSALNDRVANLEAEIAALKIALGGHLNIAV